MRSWLSFLMLLFQIEIANTQESVDEIFFTSMDPHQKIYFLDTNMEQKSHLIIAVPKNQTTKKWQFLIHEKDTSYVIELSNINKTFKGKLYRKDILYGGSFEIGENVEIYGKVRIDNGSRILNIDHNHEFTLYKLDLDNLTFEPIIFQNINFFQVRPLHQNILVQPSSVGINFIHNNARKGFQTVKIGVSAGAGFDMMQMDKGFKLMWNFRAAIPITARAAKVDRDATIW